MGLLLKLLLAGLASLAIIWLNRWFNRYSNLQAKNYVSISYARRYLGICEASLERAVREGVIYPPIILDRRRYYLRADLNKLAPDQIPVDL